MHFGGADLQFDALLARMQTPTAREAAASVGSAGTQELGEAALKGFERGE